MIVYGVKMYYLCVKQRQHEKRDEPSDDELGDVVVVEDVHVVHAQVGGEHVGQVVQSGELRGGVSPERRKLTLVRIYVKSLYSTRSTIMIFGLKCKGNKNQY